MNHKCPVCMFDKMPYPPNDYHICPCCGTEFGNDDAHFNHKELRNQWINSGAKWFFENPPENWNPWIQLSRGGHPDAVPFRVQSASGPVAAYGEFSFVPMRQALRVS